MFWKLGNSGNSYTMSTDQHRPTWLDLPISFFNAGTSNVPARQTTLRRMATTSYYRPLVEQICAEPDEAKQGELKKQLPAITPVAWLHHRRKDTSFADKIKSQWPMLMGDIDRKDNPDVDMAQLKHHLTRLAYVVLCAYSVRGGLWFVIRLPDHQTPETLAAHFRYVQRLFSKNYEVKLDTSKGGNPTDLRYVAYDAAPWLNDSPTVMDKTYTPPPPKPVFSFTSDADKTRREVEDCISQVVQRSIDLAPHYGEWFALGQSLASAFGESGRDYYQHLSQFSEKYRPDTTDRKYSECLKACSRYTIATFFEYCKNVGIKPERDQPRQKPEPKQATTPAPTVASLRSELMPPCPPNEEPVCQAKPPAPAEAETEQEYPLSTAPVSDEVRVVDPDTTPRPEPCISATKFHQWQQQHPYFSQMGINSLKHR